MALIEIQVYAGPNCQTPTKKDIQRNIDALNRAAKAGSGEDQILLLDTKSILEAIQKKLP